MISLSPVETENISDLTPDMDRIVSEHGDSLYRMAFLYLKDPHLAEDAVQEAFLKIYKSYNSFRGEANEKTWMVRITINICKNMMRQAWNRNVDSSMALENLSMEAEPDSTEYTDLVTAIMNLPAKYKDIVLLHYYQDLKTKDISAALNIPIGTVLTRLKRARDILERNLKGWCDEDEYADE
jgi:RNA polymerase sigma-70 factor (ECF subfamily)